MDRRISSQLIKILKTKISCEEVLCGQLSIKNSRHGNQKISEEKARHPTDTTKLLTFVRQILLLIEGTVVNRKNFRFTYTHKSTIQSYLSQLMKRKLKK